MRARLQGERSAAWRDTEVLYGYTISPGVVARMEARSHALTSTWRNHARLAAWHDETEEEGVVRIHQEIQDMRGYAHDVRVKEEERCISIDSGSVRCCPEDSESCHKHAYSTCGREGKA